MKKKKFIDICSQLFNWKSVNKPIDGVMFHHKIQDLNQADLETIRVFSDELYNAVKKETVKRAVQRDIESDNYGVQ